jgi:hypothetical protein
MLFMGIVHKSDTSQSVQQLADEVVVCCIGRLQKIENILSVLRPQYEMYKILEQIKVQSSRSSRSSSSVKAFSAGSTEMLDAILDMGRPQAVDPDRDEKIRIKNQYEEAIIQHKRYTVYVNFAKKVRLAFDSAQ